MRRSRDMTHRPARQLTRDFKVTVRERLQRDPSFREALLVEAVACLLSGDVKTGESLLCDYADATTGFCR